MKALYRRAEARKGREEWDEAERDYTRLIAMHEEQAAATVATPISEKERVDDLVFTCCKNSLRDLKSRRSSQAARQRKKMDGFMSRLSEDGLYEDLPLISPTAPKPDPEDDYSWLNQHSQTSTSLLTKVRGMFGTIVDTMRGWCGQKKKTHLDETKAD